MLSLNLSQEAATKLFKKFGKSQSLLFAFINHLLLPWYLGEQLALELQRLGEKSQVGAVFCFHEPEEVDWGGEDFNLINFRFSKQVVESVFNISCPSGQRQAKAVDPCGLRAWSLQRIIKRMTGTLLLSFQFYLSSVLKKCFTQRIYHMVLQSNVI